MCLLHPAAKENGKVLTASIPTERANQENTGRGLAIQKVQILLPRDTLPRNLVLGGTEGSYRLMRSIRRPYAERPESYPGGRGNRGALATLVTSIGSFRDAWCKNIGVLCGGESGPGNERRVDPLESSVPQGFQVSD